MAQTKYPASPAMDTSRIFDAEIAAIDKELAKITRDMEKTSREFILATIASLKTWYPSTAKSYVREQYKLSHELGVTRIRELKKNVAQLIAVVPKEAERLLCDGNLWWHKSRGGGWQDHYAQGPPDGLRMAIWALAERIGPTLESYGYITKPQKPDTANGTGTTERRARERSKRHALPDIEWTGEMTRCIEAYKKDLSRAICLDGKLHQARRRKAIHRAELLWDQA